MRVLVAAPRGYCAGVDRAIQIVELALARYGAPIYVRKEIVHNRFVVARLRSEGAIFVEALDQVPNGALVIFSAHGVSPTVKAEAAHRGLRAIDATCPLVSKVHNEVLRYVRRDYALVLIGHVGHDEVVGTLGHAPESITLVSTADQAREVSLPADRPLMVLTQTTLSVDDTAQILDVLKARFPRLEQPGSDDICYATQNRQDAVKALIAEGIELLIVVGSTNSSNAARLVDVAERSGVAGHLVDEAHQLDPAWLDGLHTVGVTSGASTPEPLVQGVIEQLRQLGADEVDECQTVAENVVFSLPPALRSVVSP